MNYSRRSFLKRTSLSLGTLGISSLTAMAKPDVKVREQNERLLIGLVADAHKDIMHDADKRLNAFVQKAVEREVDAVIQMGDFCFPTAKNRDFFQLLGEYKGPVYHILGNHDMDTSTKEATMDYWNMPAKYYSFDLKGYHFVVLDANYLYTEGRYIDYSNANFYVDSTLRTFVNPEQLAWLKEDLANTSLPTFVFSHQSLAHDLWGVKNRLHIQQIMEEANEKAGFNKVVACFNGHNHIDFQRNINGIFYIDINSLSYSWLGEKFACYSRYDSKVYDDHPTVAYVAPYEEPLFAFLSIENGAINIEGVRSNWVGPSPGQLGMPEDIVGSERSPEISDYAFKVGQ